MLRKYLIFSLTAVFSLSHIILYAEEPLSLNYLILEARKNNPEILAMLKRYEAAKARIPQAKSLDDPVIGIDFEKSKGNPFNFSTSPAMDRKLSVSQMLPWFGKLPLKGKIALVESQMVASEYKNKELAVINEVKNAYYDLFLNYKEAELKKENLRLLENIASIAEARYIVGEIAQEDIFKINLEISKLSNDILNLKYERGAKEARLNSLLNRGPDSPLAAPYLEDEDASYSVDLPKLYKLTLQNQPELLIFSYAIERNKYAKSLAMKSFFPDLMAGIVMRGFTTGSIGPWDLMMAFSVPLWFWTKQRYEVKEAIANLGEAEAAYQAIKNKMLAGTKRLASDIEISKSKINLYKNIQIPLLESSIGSLVSVYRSGKGDIMMLLDSERMLVDAKMFYYKALVEYNMNLADLEKAVGSDLKKAEK